MKAKQILIKYEIDGAPATASHSNKTVAEAVWQVSEALVKIDEEDGYTTRSRILKVDAKY